MLRKTTALVLFATASMSLAGLARADEFDATPTNHGPLIIGGVPVPPFDPYVVPSAIAYVLGGPPTPAAAPMPMASDRPMRHRKAKRHAMKASRKMTNG